MGAYSATTGAREFAIAKKLLGQLAWMHRTNYREEDPRPCRVLSMQIVPILTPILLTHSSLFSRPSVPDPLWK
jgi:hypothetical protein